MFLFDMCIYYQEYHVHNVQEHNIKTETKTNMDDFGNVFPLLPEMK